MRNRALRTFLLTFLVAGTSAIVNASPAQAAHFAMTGEPFLNQAVIHGNVLQDSGAYAAQAVAVSADTSHDAWSTGDRGTNGRVTPGGAFTLRVDWTFEDPSGDTPDTGCDGSGGNPTAFRVEIRNMNGSQIGSDPWDGTISASNKTNCDTGISKNFYLDNDPVDDDASALDGNLAAGTYELFISLSGDSIADGVASNLSDSDSRGDLPNGPAISTFNARAFLIVGGFQAGFYQEGNDHKELFWIEDNLGKEFPMVRDFASTWGLPSTTRITNAGGYMDDDKIVVWSVKPPAADAESRWKNAADDTTMIASQLSALNSAAVTHGVPYAVWSVGHEPHDDTSYGSAAEYRSIFDAAMAQKQTACGGSVCSKVLIAYIAVQSNMTTGSPVGSTDTYRPDDADFDLLGADPYNWGCWRKYTDTSAPGDADEVPRVFTDNNSTCKDNSEASPNNEWRSLEKAIDDPASSSSLLDLAALHDKKVILAEVGSHPGCNGVEADIQSGPFAGFNCDGALTNDSTWDRANFFNDAGTYLLNDDEGVRFVVGFTYYHVNNLDENGDGHSWDFNDYNENGTSSPDVLVQAVDERGRAAWISNFVNGSKYASDGTFFTLDPTP